MVGDLGAGIVGHTIKNDRRTGNMSAIGALRELEKDKKGPNNTGLKVRVQCDKDGACLTLIATVAETQERANRCATVPAGTVREPADPDSSVWPREGRHQLRC
jgi:hypothetical protein